MSVVTWGAKLAARDPGGLGLSRGLRAAVVGPVVFAFSIGVLGNDAIALSGVFGGSAAVLFADFGGTPRSRARAYLLLAAIGAALLAVGTWVSASPLPAVILTFVLVAIVRLLANLGPRWAAAMSPTILAFVLGALVPAPASVIPDRILGWILGLGAATIASALILPNRTSVRIDAEAANACDALVDAFGSLSSAETSDVDRTTAGATVRSAREHLRRVALMPSRPAGGSADAMARRQMLDRLTRVCLIVEATLQDPPRILEPDLAAMTDLAVQTLARAAFVLRTGDEVDALVACLDSRDQVRNATFSRHFDAVRDGTDPATVVRDVDAGFAIRASTWHVDVAGRNVAFLTGDATNSFSTEPIVVVPDVTRAGQRGRIRRLVNVHAVPSSVWFRDALRAGIAVAVSVALAFALDIQHGFWVALGTLSVLRSCAFATGRSAVSAAAGTAVGFGIAALAFVVVGVDDPALWILLILGFFAAGYLPQVAGLIAGQAAFTVAVIALFNIVEPTGWKIGLVRLENVALGVGVSALVALLFWPRRLEPLVGRLMTALSTSAGAALAATLVHPADPTWREQRDAVGVIETRTRAAMAEFMVQLRTDPSVVDSWISRLGVASQARAAADALVAIRGFVPDEHGHDGFGDPDLDRVLHHAALGLGHDLAPGRGAPSPACHPHLATATLDAAEAAVGFGRGDPAAVTRSLLARDWLLATAHMVDTRP